MDERKFLAIDVDNFDERMKSMKPRVAFSVPNTLTGEGNLSVDITFESMDDFSPAAVARKVDALSKLLEARSQLANLVTYMDGKAGRRGADRQGAERSGAVEIAGRQGQAAKNRGVEPWPKRSQTSCRHGGRRGGGSVRRRCCRRSSSRRPTARVPRSRRAVQTLAEQALRETAVVSDDVIGTIKAIIAEIDKKLSDQINLILHNERFQQVESAWRGLHYLVNNTETDEMLKIRVMNISKKDLGKTLKKYKGAAWDQSPLFKKLYEEEYGQLGGEPYGALVGDYYFDHTPGDVELLGQMAQIAAAAHAPFIAGGGPDVDGHGFLAGAGQPARPGEDFRRSGLRRLAFAARVGRCEVRGPGDAAVPGAPALRREDEPGGGVRVRGGDRRRATHSKYSWAELRRTPWRSTSTAPSSSTAGARRSAASSPAARSRACRCIPSRAMTAAWT